MDVSVPPFPNPALSAAICSIDPAIPGALGSALCFFGLSPDSNFFVPVVSQQASHVFLVTLDVIYYFFCLNSLEKGK